MSRPCYSSGSQPDDFPRTPELQRYGSANSVHSYQPSDGGEPSRTYKEDSEKLVEYHRDGEEFRCAEPC